MARLIFEKGEDDDGEARFEPNHEDEVEARGEHVEDEARELRRNCFCDALVQVDAPRDFAG